MITPVGEGLQISGLGTDPLTLQASGSYRARSGRQLRFAPAQGSVRQVVVVTRDGDTTTFELLKKPELSPSQLADYAGDYYSPEIGSTIRVRVDSARLMLRTSPDEELILVPFYADGFRVGPTGATGRFVRDERGRIRELRVFAGRARNVLFERVAAH